MVAHIRSDAIEVLLAASKMGDLPSRQRTLNMAAGILRDQSPKYLWGTIAYEQSVLSRLQADFNHSENVIEEFCRRTGNLNNSGLNIRDFYHGLQPNSVSKRLNAIYGCLHVSHLENLVQCEKYNIAVDEVDDWTPLNPSAKELRVLSSKQVTVAKIFRSQGRFEDARTTLETCLRQNVNRIQVLCSLADAYCDLGLPKKAYAILAPEIETERNKARRGKPFRRLVISAIDAILGQYLYQDAARTIQEAVTIFNNLSNLDVSDELLHVRVLVASARIAHYESQFSEAMKRWEIALDHVQRYGSFAGEGFTYAVIHLSICLAHLESNNMTKGWESFQHAERILCRGMRDFWIPTFATRWYPDTRARIETLKGWALCKSAQKAA
jgi:tetratricopeptide (TPR) repeat protein